VYYNGKLSPTIDLVEIDLTKPWQRASNLQPLPNMLFVQTLPKALEKEVATSDRLRSERDEARNKVEQVPGERNEARKKVEEYRGRFKKQHDQIAKLQGQVVEQTTEAARQTIEASRQRDEAVKQAAQADAHEQVAEILRERQTYQVKETMQADLKQSAENLKQSEQTISRLDSEIKALKAETLTAAAQLANVSTQLTTATAEKALLSQSLTTIQRQLQETKAELQRTQRERDNAKVSVQKLTEELDAFKMLRSEHTQLSTLRQINDDTTSQLSLCQNKLITTEELCDEHERENKQLRAAADAIERKAENDSLALAKTRKRQSSMTQVFDGCATRVKDEPAYADEPVKEAGSLEGQVGLRERVIADRRRLPMSTASLFRLTGFKPKDTSDLANPGTTKLKNLQQRVASVKVENDDLHPRRI
jgi:epidermal growth factor receptor substrate 15